MTRDPGLGTQDSLLLRFIRKKWVDKGLTASRILPVCDVHTHLIPGIDDGPAEFEEVVEMLELAYRAGTREVVATPHLFLEPYRQLRPAGIARSFGSLLEQIAERGRSDLPFLQDISLYLGVEHFVCVDFLEALDRDEVLTINHSRYLLIEFPSLFPWERISDVVSKIRSRDYLPLIAHAERYAPIQADPRRAEELLEQGSVLQINGSSLEASSPRNERETALELLRRNLGGVIASDAHGVDRRPLQLLPALLALRELFPEEKIREWVLLNPQKIVRDERFRD